MIFAAGQIPLNPSTGEIVGANDIVKQFVQVMANQEAVLAAAGAKPQDIVKTTVFLADMNDFAAMNQVYARYFDEASAPARACVQVSRLPKDVLVEIVCFVVVSFLGLSSYPMELGQVAMLKRCSYKFLG